MHKEHKSVLIVDDDPNQINIVKLYLKDIDLDITTAKNGRHAISILKEKKFDIILTDFQMPEMDGETMILKIRNELKLSVPIYMISANDNQKSIEKLKNVKILRKPFTIQQIQKIFR